jgi:glutamate-1-semialdehyde 2,1-aminomutase
VSELKLDRSRELFARAEGLLPGGVSSPVRAFKSVGGTPIFFKQGQGGEVTDEDGNTFVDFCMSWGPLALGHAHPDVLQAVTESAALGTSFGAPTVYEVELAEQVMAMQPLAERVRFVSSGTEAVMSAVRLARGHTGRDLLVKFDGCYHGHADYLLVKAGSGLATSGQPDSAGVPAGIADTTAVLPLNDPEAFKAFFAERGSEVAAVIVEPVPANCGLLLQTQEFLQLLRDETAKAGALLIFDEVISGFRLGPGGAAAHYGITPDLLTYGKVIGGGLPVGAYAGKREVMESVAPLGPVYQAGTLSGNPVAMAAGKAALQALQNGGYERLNANAETLAGLLEPHLAKHPVSLVRIGSIGWLSFQQPAPVAWGQADKSGAERYKVFHREMLARGIYLAPSVRVSDTETPRFLAACRGEPVDRPPLWLMRQAGRYLPEYWEVRNKAGDFLTLCHTPDMAVEVTLQPIRRFGFDASIVFSDILVPAEAICGYVFETISTLVRELKGTPLIGFTAAPWTLACYMVEGGGSKNFSHIKSMFMGNPELARQLMDRLVDYTVKHAVAEVKAGAQAFQLFETWAELWSPQDYATWCLPYANRVFAGMKEALGDAIVPLLYFSKGGAGHLQFLPQIESDVIGVDWRLDLTQARAALPGKAIQGNLDPLVLYAGPEVTRERAKQVLAAGGGTGHVFNLGHGILPETPIPSVEALVETVRDWKG